MSKKRLLMASAISGIVLLGYYSPLFAQTSAGPSATTVQEVVVTAEKRTERLQAVPASIVAVSGAQLQLMSATSYADYLNTIPGVTFANNGGFDDRIFIRGLGDSLSSQAVATTGLYLDETPVSEVTATLADIGTYDINRVEVLKGPQGTLYGSESMGGTVRVITNKPDLSSYSGDIDASVSDTYHAGGANYDLNAMINAPLIADKLGARLVIGDEHDSGYIDNIYTGQNDVNSIAKTSVRAMLDAKPITNLDILFTYQYQNDIQDEGANEDIGLPNYKISRAYPDKNHFITNIYNMTINYDLPFATLTSSTSYIDKQNFSVRDLTPVYGSYYSQSYNVDTGITIPANTGVGLTYRFPNKALVQELRLTSTSSGPFHWIAGLYYNDLSPTTQQTIISTDAALANYNFYTSSTKSDQTEVAEFAQIDYEITSKLTLTAGVRHANYTLTNYNISSGDLNGGVSTIVADATETATSAKFAANYKVTPSNLVYAQASQGFRPGGVNGDVPDACLSSLQAIGYSNANQVFAYNPDSLWEYELGSKNQFLRGALTVNGDIYYIDWKHAQVAQNLACGDQILSNSAGVTSEGAELEIKAHPLAGLNLSFAADYEQATFDQTSVSAQTVAGATLPNVPKWSLSGSGEYTHHVYEDINGYIFGNINFVDSRMNDLPLVQPNFYLPSYVDIGMRVGITRGPLDIALYVKNLTNKIAFLSFSYDSGYNYLTINEPRTVGLEVNRHF